MNLSTLDEWLEWIASVHSSEIELGLERIKPVAARLGVLTPTCPVIIVGGTNGKGSTVAGLSAIYRAENYQVGTFTSPFLFRHNEEVRINEQEASDAEFCAAFTLIEKARGEILLTPFEYHTLAALLILKTYPLDVMILEVGLGGRLDAVNIIDADVAIVTTIALDHTAWLGTTREAIAYEKAGIFRPHKRAVCGDNDPPASLITEAMRIAAPFVCQGRDFHYREYNDHWVWSYQDIIYTSLPKTPLALQNMATVLMAVTTLQSRLPVTTAAVVAGLTNVSLAGRIEVIHTPVMQIYDVAHNPAAISLLVSKLKQMPCQGKTYAVFSMLADKDIKTSIELIRSSIDAWYVAPLQTKRATTVVMLREIFAQLNMTPVIFATTIKEAKTLVFQQVTSKDRVVIFGSFHTVAEALCLNA